MKSPLELDAVSVREIVAYWELHQEEAGLGVDWADAHKRCWRCGLKSRLQKCHIVPRARSGPASPSNLVLLCRRCHRAAPNIANPKYMWIWLRATCVPFYDMFIYAEAFLEFERLFGRQPFHGCSKREISELFCDVDDIYRSTVIHFGEGRTNAATLACIIAEIEETKLGRTPTPRRSSWILEHLFASRKPG